MCHTKHNFDLVIKGGTVVNADQSFRADVYCEDGIIQAVGPDMDAPSGVHIVDGGGCGSCRGSRCSVLLSLVLRSVLSRQVVTFVVGSL